MSVNYGQYEEQCLYASVHIIRTVMASVTRFNHTEIEILTFLEKTSTHVRGLRRELDDNGAVSSYLKHLQELGLVKRENRKGRVVNTLTPKGRQVAKALKILNF